MARRPHSALYRNAHLYIHLEVRFTPFTHSILYTVLGSRPLAHQVQQVPKQRNLYPNTAEANIRCNEGG